MKRIISVSILLVLLVSSCGKPTTKLRILAINIWLSGTVVDNGFNVIVDNVVNLNPDVVIFSEADSAFVPKIVTALKAKGLIYYGQDTQDAALISKYKIVDQHLIFPDKGDVPGTVLKTTLDVNGQTVIIYPAHLDYTHYACYLPRGYSGITWKKMDAPMLNVDSIQAENEASTRVESIKKILADAKEEKEKGNLIILGGDFNEASHLDWGEATKNLRDHHGVIVPWYCSVHLKENGFVDAYRKQYPDPVAHPGFTYPSSNMAAPINKLTWAPTADERERIDYIYYMDNNSIKLDSISVVGPSGCIVRNERVENDSKDTFIAPCKVWPTDHKAVFAIFELTSK